MTKNWRKRCLAGVLAVLTGCMAIVNAGSISAQEDALKDELEQILAGYVIPDDVTEDEIVVAEELQIEKGAEFEPENDLTKLIYAPDKVNVMFKEFNLYNGQPFDVNMEGIYLAVYHAEPMSGHSPYDIARKIIVKESESVDGDIPQDTGIVDETGSEQDTQLETDLEGASDTTESLLTEAESQEAAETGETFIADAVLPESLEDVSDETSAEMEATGTGVEIEQLESELQTESITEWTAEEMQSETVAEISDVEIPDATETGMQNEMKTEAEVSEVQSESETENLSDEELLDKALEESEDQKTFDEESGLALHDVLEQAAEAGINLASLETNETVSFMAISDTGVKTVDVSIVAAYNYADYGLGSFSTHQYKVVFGGITATAYCVQPSKGAPSDGTYTITKLKDGKTLAKVCYYGTKASGSEGFFAEKHPDFSAGKRFIITHIAAAYANGSSDAFAGTNETGRSLAMELYNYCVAQPSIPDVDMDFSEADTVAYVDGDHQRTKEITFKADELQSITMKLPSGVKMHNVTTGKTSKAGADVELTGGTKFYLTAPLTQATDVKQTWSSRMKGSVTKDFSAYKITIGGNMQDLALVFGEGVDDEKFVSFSVTWVNPCKVAIVKKDAETNGLLAGAVFGVYGDKACTQLLAEMPPTDANGASSVELYQSSGTVYLKEITPPKGYEINTSAQGVTLVTGDTVTTVITNQAVYGGLTIYKEGEVLTGANVTEGGTTFVYEKRRQKGAVYNVYAATDITSPTGGVAYANGALVAENLVTGDDGSVSLTKLIPGQYRVTEMSAPVNLVNSGESKEVTVTAGESNAETVFATVTFINDRQKASVSVVKTDNETKTPLEGGSYALYAASQITNADGTVVVQPDTFIEKVTTTQNGSAAFTADIPCGFSYYVKEVKAPENYVRNSNDIFTFDFQYAGGTEAQVAFSHTFENRRVSAKIKLVKIDAETGVPQGDATLTNAVYGLYAREDISHPDKKTGIRYHAGEQVATLTTDANGEASVEGLYLGNYYFKEIAASTGYTLSTEEYDVACTYEGDEVPVVEKECTVKEDVIKQPFQLIKVANNGKTDADLLSGVGFTTYLVSSLATKADGSYDFEAASPIVTGPDGATEIFTDNTGHAVSIPIPFGTYLVRETTTPHNYSPVRDFVVRITEHHPTEPQVWRVLLDDEFKAKLKIIKQDDETKRSVLIGGTEFKVYNVDKGEYVEQVTTYPTTMTHTSYYTDEEGYLILPNALEPGRYRIEEQRAPAGYTLNTDYIEIVIDSDTMYYMDEVSQDIIIEAVYENHPVKAKLTIYKIGEILKGFGKDFEYEEQKLEGAKFAVYAAEDIYTADYQRDAQGNRILEYAKDALVATVTTDEEGKASIGELPLGTYRVEELEAPAGFVLNKDSQDVTFLYEGQDVPVVNESVTFKNERQRVQISALKRDALNDALLPGAVFGLYNKEDIVSGDKVIVSADTLLEEAKSGDDGRAVFSMDLPIGHYYVKETKAPSGYVSSEEILELDASYQGQEVPIIRLEAEKKNEPTVTEFTKSDITTGEELNGAQLTVSDKEGNIIDSWVSEKGKPHVIKRLVVGETYILREVMAPYGYLKAEEVEFTISDTTEIQKVEMKDEVPVAVLIINKRGEFLDKVTLLENAKGTVEHLFEYLTGSISKVTFEVYAAEDIKAADGVSEDYFKADELVDTITTDGSGVAKLEGLPAGKYYVKEVETAHGFVLDGEPRYIDLSYRDQDTPVITFDERWQNVRQKVSVHVVKRERGSNRTLAGGIFGLFAKDDILSLEGKVLIEADTIIEEKTTDQNGEITFMADLPVDGSYYIRELYAPDGFATTDDIQEFVFEYAGQDEADVKYEFVFENDPTIVSITKSDVTTGGELPGAHLVVIDENANTVDSWVSGTEPHLIRELTAGKSYTLIETIPANGYATAESITFTVQDTGEVQPVEMKDDVTKVLISKTDITDGSEIEGAKLTVLDENGTIRESWISGTEPHYIEKLPVGNYRLREETAPDGYVVAEEVPFTVEDTGEIQTVKMEDERVKGKLRIRKVDSENKAPLEGVTFELKNKVTGKVVAELTTDKEGKAESGLLPVGQYKNGKMKEPIVYILQEKKPLEGYEDGKEEEIVFSIEDGDIPVIELEREIENTRLPGIPYSPQTGDDTNIVGPLVIAILSLAGIIILALRMKRRNAKRVHG